MGWVFLRKGIVIETAMDFAVGGGVLLLWRRAQMVLCEDRRFVSSREHDGRTRRKKGKTCGAPEREEERG
jgi:hypothetical protein